MAGTLDVEAQWAAEREASWERFLRFAGEALKHRAGSWDEARVLGIYGQRYGEIAKRELTGWVAAKRAKGTA